MNVKHTNNGWITRNLLKIRCTKRSESNAVVSGGVKSISLGVNNLAEFLSLRIR
jgi:hypothetical protein